MNFLRLIQYVYIIYIIDGLLLCRWFFKSPKHIQVPRSRLLFETSLQIFVVYFKNDHNVIQYLKIILMFPYILMLLM